MATPTAQRAAAISILLLAPSEAAEALRERLRDWSAAELLHPFLCVMADVTADGAVPLDDQSVLAFAINDGKCEETDLFEALRKANPQVIRLVVVQLLPGPELDPGGHSLRVLAEELGQHLRELRAAGEQRLITLNLIVPTARMAAVPADTILLPGWHANVVLSPEDRSGVGELASKVLGGARLAGHAALGCAVIGALWRQIERGPFDGERQQVGGNEGRIVVARCFSRVLDGRDLPQRTVGQLVGETAAFALPQQLRQLPEGVRKSFQPFRAAEARRAFLNAEGQVLGGRLEPEEEPDAVMARLRTAGHARRPAPRRLVFRMIAPRWMLSSIVRLSWRPLELRLSEGLELISARQRNWLQRYRFIKGTETSKDLADIRHESKDAEIIYPSANNLRWVAHQIPVDPRAHAPVWAPPNREFWAELRRLCFGLVDGGPLPRGVASRLGTYPRYVSEVWLIVPDPDDAFEVPDGPLRQLLQQSGMRAERIRPCDAREALKLQEKLGAIGSERGGAQRTAARSCVAALAEWMSHHRREGSLLWLLARYLSAELDRATEAFNRASIGTEEEITALLEGLQDELRAKHKRLRPGFRICLAIAASLLAVFLLGFWPNGIWSNLPPAYPVALFISVWAVVVAGGLTVWGQYAWKERDVLRRLHDMEESWRHAAWLMRRWPTEADRLGALYQCLMDWSEIIGYMLHRPFGRPSEAHEPQPAAGSAPIPAAFQLAHSDQQDESVHEVVTRAARQVFGGGWVTPLYERVAAESMDGYNRQIGGTRSDVPPSPDDSSAPYDPPDDGPVDPLRHLESSERAYLLYRTFRTDEEYARLSRAAKTENIKRALAAIASDDLAGDASGDSQMAAFFRPILPAPARGRGRSAPFAPWVWAPGGQVDLMRQVRQVYLWCPASLASGGDQADGANSAGGAGGGTAAEPVEWIPDPHQAASNYLFQVTRLDLSEDCDPSDLAIFCESAERQAAGAVGE